MDGVCDVFNNMSTSDDNKLSVCANCGKEGSDVTNTCNKCKMVMYCNAACKKKHRHKHKKECERRLAELYDEKLFKQPPPEEDCPICMIRLPSQDSGTIYMACCGKVICCGCVYAYRSRVTKKEHNVCPFCRTPPPSSDEEEVKRLEKRIELDDAQAIYNLACYYGNGELGLPQDYAKALDLWHRAGQLDSAEAYTEIGNAYKVGRGVEVDMKKAKHYYELAAMSGDAKARNSFGIEEAKLGNMDRALRHWMIAARDGNLNSLGNVKKFYLDGHATKDDYTNALHSYQSYLDEIKSDERDEIAAFSDDFKYYESAL